MYVCHRRQPQILPPPPPKKKPIDEFASQVTLAFLAIHCNNTLLITNPILKHEALNLVQLCQKKKKTKQNLVTHKVMMPNFMFQCS